MQPVLPGLRHQRRPSPRDLRTTTRGANRSLLVLVPNQRPAERLAPEVADLLRPFARHRSDEATLSEEVITGLDDAELIAFGVGEHHVLLLRQLTDIDVSTTEL